MALLGRVSAGQPTRVYRRAQPRLRRWVTVCMVRSRRNGADSSERRNACDSWAADYRMCRVCRSWMLHGCSGGAALEFLSMFGMRFASRWMSPTDI